LKLSTSEELQYIYSSLLVIGNCLIIKRQNKETAAALTNAWLCLPCACGKERNWILRPNQRTVFSHVIRCRPPGPTTLNALTTCELSRYDRSGSVENCSLEVPRSMKTWRKAGTIFFFLCPLLCRLDRLREKFLLCIFAFWYFSVGHWTTLRHCPSCVATRCYHEGPGAPTIPNPIPRSHNT